MIDENWLNQQMFSRYPGHKTTCESRTLIEKLTQEYMKFWRLILSFPEKRIVAPAVILTIQRVHYDDRQRYFDDCMGYFNKFLAKELRWRGRPDVIGTVDTVRSYRALYQEKPPEQWRDIVAEYDLGRPSLHLV
jgi:hypothetical protein